MLSRIQETPPSAASDRSAPRARARLKTFLAGYRPHLPLLAADLACALVVAATALSFPLLARRVTSRLADAAGDPAALPPILALGGLMLGLLALQALCTMFVDAQGHVMGAKIEAALRQRVFDHLQTLSFRFYDRHRVGQLMGRITADLFDIGELCHHGPEDLAISSLKFLGAAVLLGSIDPWLTLMVLALFPPATLYVLHFNGRMRATLAAGRAQIGAINDQVEDSLSGVRVVQAFAGEAAESRRFAAENARFLDIRRAGFISEAVFSVGMTGFAQLVTLTVIVAGAARVTQLRLDAADLVTFLLGVAILIDPVQRAANFVRLWQSGMTGFHRVIDILETAPEIADRPGARALPAVGGHVAFDRVNFGYQPGGPPVLNDVSLEIWPGEFVALVGASGVGKSTLCALVPRFYDVDAGAVRIDGVDVRDVTLASLRRQVGVVQQDVYLFAGSVADNLRYGRPDATDAELEAAARRAHAHDFIVALPEGYATDVGPRGVRLSGGQKQRLTIARAFLKDPPVLIFDEATSALDNVSERAVQAALVDLARSRTTLVIAHRLSTVRHADRILVLTADGVAEEGTHDALMAKGGVYAGLYGLQGSL